MVMRVDPQRTPLAQHYGFAPGQPIIQTFATTQPRFQKLPMDGTTDRANPGPGAYSPVITLKQKRVQRSDTSWGSEAAVGDRKQPLNERTPAPGVHGAEVPCDGGILTQLLRKWPGRAESSSFGTNAPQRWDYTKSETPGAGAYDVASSALFTTNSLGGVVAGGASPYVPEARRALGSRKRISSDTKESASFASSSERKPLDDSTAVGPGPAGYSLEDDFTMKRRQALKETALRKPAKATGRSPAWAFATSERRFTRLPFDGQPEGFTPGPGAHTVKRYGGEPKPCFQRPGETSPHVPKTSHVSTGFNSSAERTMSDGVPIGQMSSPGPGRYAIHEMRRHSLIEPGFNATMPHAADKERARRLAAEHARHRTSAEGRQPMRVVHNQAPSGQDVIAYLATGEAGAAGTKMHRQTLLRLLREAATNAQGS